MQVSRQILEVLEALNVQSSFGKYHATITQALDRKLYIETNKVLEACGGEWNRKAKAHVFFTDPAGKIEQVILTGEVTTDQDLGFFVTPPPLAEFIVELAGVKPGHVVLEPSAGDGAIVRAILRAGGTAEAVEFDRARCSQLNLMMRTEPHLCWVHEGDFMAWVTDEPFDRVVMNPPFCKVGIGDHLDHVRHAFSMLLPGGTLAAILPQGVLFRTGRYKVFREWAERYGNFIELPDDSFKTSGTSVRTCALRMVSR